MNHSTNDHVSSTAMQSLPQKDYRLAQTMADFQTNLAEVHQRIANACQRVNRNVIGVRLLPVSKTVDELHLRLAYAAGCRFFGENKAQEGRNKAQALADLADLRWSMIGHLQTNKVKMVTQFAYEFQALDRLSIAEALERHLQAAGKPLDVFVQVNTSQEKSKYGLAPAEVIPFMRKLSSFSTLRIRGLMTLALFSHDANRVRQCFKILRQLRDQLRQDVPHCTELQELSMGMSNDFEIAIEEGATVIRIGQAIFGARMHE